MSEESVWLERARAVREARSDNFMELHRLSGLDPAKDYRFGDWSGIDFSNCVLEGFNFVGARLINCNFYGAVISGARFDQAEINGASLRAAIDWEIYKNNWPYFLKKNIGNEVVFFDELLFHTRDGKHLPNFAIFQDAPFVSELVVIPPGNFIMGSKEGEEREREYPQHKVTIDYRLAVGRFAVTFEEWDFYCSRNPNAHKPNDEDWGRDTRPVINVSWEDAQGYVQWLSEKTGYQYRLLTEAEWEYCCRAGTNTKYSFGETITKKQAKFSESIWGSAKHTVPVGQYQPNDFGLYDMHGNVYEWCEDDYHDNYKDAPKDGSAWLDEGAEKHNFRVLRGGSWSSNPLYLRSIDRGRDLSRRRSKYDGFRVARTLGEVSR